MQNILQWMRRNKGFTALLAAELAVLLALVAGLFGAPYTLTLTPSDFDNDFSDIAAVKEDGSALQIYNDGSFHTEDEITFSSRGCALPSGAYELTISYFSCETPDAPTFSVLQSAGTLTFSSEKVPSAVQMDPLTLDDGHRTVSTRLWVSSGARLEDLTATLTYNGGQLYLYSLALTEQPIYRLTRLVCFAVFFALADFLGWLFFACAGARGAARRKSLALPLAIAGITLVACLPLFSDQLYFGHDLRYHLQRITAMAKELSYGQFPVRIATTSLNGYGYINPLCYCELFLTLPALLYNAWLPLRTCYQIYVFAVTLAACGFSDRPLGLDIQQCTDADYFRIANRYYNRSDQELLKRTETENLPDLFFRIWTKEESYAKWLGTALGQTIGKENKTGVCHCFVPLPGYQAAVWTDKPEEPEICFRDSATVHPRRSAAESG